MSDMSPTLPSVRDPVYNMLAITLLSRRTQSCLGPRIFHICLVGFTFRVVMFSSAYHRTISGHHKIRSILVVAVHDDTGQLAMPLGFAPALRDFMVI
jgi:hypothetical protein